MLSLNKIRFLLFIDFEKEIKTVFKLLNTNDIAKLLEKNTRFIFSCVYPEV